MPYVPGLSFTSAAQFKPDHILLQFCPGVDHWSLRVRSWVQVLSRTEGLPLSFILLGADTAWQAISQRGKARMQDATLFVSCCKASKELMAASVAFTRVILVSAFVATIARDVVC